MLSQSWNGGLEQAGAKEVGLLAIKCVGWDSTQSEVIEDMSFGDIGSVFWWF